jgi:effector-binding domain-containing protein
MEGVVALKEVADLFILGVRFRTSMEKIQGDMGAKFGALFAYLGELGQPPAGPPFTLYYGEVFDPADFEMELCVPVASLPESRGEIVARELDGGTMACTMHQGPYDQVKEAYGLLEAWVKDNGYRYAGPAREIYLNDPSQVPEAELLTEVQFPVEKA